MPVPTVIFATTTFHTTSNGPSTYTQYLWKAFRNSQSFKFIIAAADTSEYINREPPKKSLRPWKKTLYEQVAARALALAQCEKNSPLFIHANSAQIAMPLLNCGIPVIQQINDYETCDANTRFLHNTKSYGVRRALTLAWRRRQEKLVTRRVPVTICNSHFTLKKVVQSYQIPNPKNLTVIHKAVDTNEFTPSANPCPVCARRLLFVGSDWKRKGLVDLLNAMPLVLAKTPEAELTVVGDFDTESVNTLQQICNQLGVRDKVVFAGKMSRSGMPEVYRNNHLLVLPTHREALGVAILESLSAGLPIITCPVGGVPEIVEHGSSAWLTPPNDVNLLAKSIVCLLKDVDLRRKLVEKGLSRARHFSIDKMKDAVEELYHRLFEALGAARQYISQNDSDTSH